MQKTKNYYHTRFGAEVLEEALVILNSIADNKGIDINTFILSVEHDDSLWKYDTKEEFYSDYRKYSKEASFRFWGTGIGLDVNIYENYTNISIASDNRTNIGEIFEIFERNKEKYYTEPTEEPEDVIVFIGHGASNHWRDLKDHLQDKHQIKIETYETGARAGHTIRDILEDMVEKSTFALLVMTAEDMQGDGQIRARQNVIHEIGLFQGKLGFNRAIIMMENEVEEFSNISGVQQIRYNNISETFGEVLATIKREFK